MKATIKRRADKEANEERKVPQEMETRIPGAAENLWGAPRGRRGERGEEGAAGNGDEDTGSDREPVGFAERRGSLGAGDARLPLQPVRRGPRGGQLWRGQHLHKGQREGPRRARGGRAVG